MVMSVTDPRVADAPLRGRIVRWRAKPGYGFIAASDGRVVYFNRNSVTDGGLRRLRKGGDVWLVVARDDAIGPRASSVHPAGAAAAS